MNLITQTVLNPVDPILTFKEFARKIIGPNADGGIPHEAKVIDDLGLNNPGGGHVNLIAVLRHNQLPHSHLYYIDMELCDFDLHDYIHSWSLYDLSGPERKRSPSNIFNITREIASGLEFIHKHNKVHRDLKPQNSEHSISSFK